MKNKFSTLLAGAALMTLVACDNNETKESTTSSDSSINTTTTNASAGETSASVTTSGTSVTPGTYVDLYTGKQVSIDKDAETGKWVDVSTRTPVEYYISTDLRDTFDMTGRNVSFSLDRTNDGKYMVDETRYKVKMDGDGDMKAKGSDGSKIKYDESSDQLKVKNADGSKEKISDDGYKKKTDSTTIKRKQ